jgi:hypothetical protein
MSQAALQTPWLEYESDGIHLEWRPLDRWIGHLPFTDIHTGKKRFVATNSPDPNHDLALRTITDELLDFAQVEQIRFLRQPTLTKPKGAGLETAFSFSSAPHTYKPVLYLPQSPWFDPLPSEALEAALRHAKRMGWHAW